MLYIYINFFFITGSSDQNTFPPVRKRQRRVHLWKKNAAKEKVERGEMRKTKTKVIPAKKFKAQTLCACKTPCSEKIDLVRQEELYNAYYGRANHAQKVLIIRSCATIQPTKPKKQAMFLPLPKPKRKREITIQHHLTDDSGQQHQVCRSFILNLYQIPPATFRRYVKSVTDNPSAMERRGIAPCKKKTSDDDLNFIRTFINLVPQYESHYGRSSSQKKYLKPGLTIRKLYEEYVQLCAKENRQSVKDPIFRRIFDTEFNLSFKRAHTDTCKTCDSLDASLRDPKLTAERKDAIITVKVNHHLEAGKIHKEFEADVNKARTTENSIILTFDLQKALATPYITTSIVFYKRQLWTYNLCVFDDANQAGN